MTAPIVHAPDCNLRFEVMCDANDFSVGDVLGKKKDKTLHVLYYASRTLGDVQRIYATTRKKITRCIFAFEKF